jgi:hypothetical protein
MGKSTYVCKIMQFKNDFAMIWCVKQYHPNQDAFLRPFHIKVTETLQIQLHLVQAPRTSFGLLLAAEDIFGPDIGSLKGKTTRRKPHRVRSAVSRLPLEIIERYRSLTLCADLMYVNGILFLLTILRKLKFGIIEALPNRLEATLIAGLVSTVRVYKQRGFSVSLGLTDGEFNMPGIRESLAGEGVALDSTGRDEHVGDIERYVRTVKERMRATYNTLPFTHMPPHLVIEMAKQAIFCLHSFPRVDGVSDHMSPREIMTGQRLDYA